MLLISTDNFFSPPCSHFSGLLFVVWFCEHNVFQTLPKAIELASSGLDETAGIQVVRPVGLVQCRLLLGWPFCTAAPLQCEETPSGEGTPCRAHSHVQLLLGLPFLLGTRLSLLSRPKHSAESHLQVFLMDQIAELRLENSRPPFS